MVPSPTVTPYLCTSLIELNLGNVFKLSFLVEINNFKIWVGEFNEVSELLNATCPSDDPEAKKKMSIPPIFSINLSYLPITKK